MLGMYAAYAPQFLLASLTFTTLVFALPMIFVPVAWGRTMRFAIPEQTDLIVYFGRCLGSFALVGNGLALRAALTGVGIAFVFQLLLAFSALMVFVHIYGAVKRIQPMTETIETAFWAFFVLLCVLFYPVAFNA